METTAIFLKQLQNALSGSIDPRTMIHLTRELIPDYEISTPDGLPESFTPSRVDIAAQIVKDIQSHNLIIPFINIMLRIQFIGYMGRKYKISGFTDLLKSLYEMGFSLDSKSGVIYENPAYRVSRNWGILQEGNDYSFCFMWTDLVNYSSIVRNYSKSEVQKFYSDYMHIIRTNVEKRNGRIWFVDGDGILSAFHFSDSNQSGVLSAIEILHTVHDYNLFSKTINNEMQIRISIEAGSCEYSDNHEDTKKCEIIQKTISNEKKAKPNTAMISRNVAMSVDEMITSCFYTESKSTSADYYFYKLEWEK
ncbi:MAG: hypothetical protein JW982_14125 [Spirochaetes bacterium]|nr:hypothetical protein [Spirochaetota bacterium]